MRILILAAAAIGAVITLQPSTVQARELPFCLISANTTDRGDCSYYTYQQCMATASGQRAYCDRNYFLGSYGGEPDDRVYSRRRRAPY
jgi:hypothetical protein